MSRDINPYEPPPAESPISWVWDRSVLSQAAFGIQLFVLIAYCIFTAHYEKSTFAAITDIVPAVQVLTAVCAILTFAIIFVATITKTDWPLHLRCSLIGLDLFFFSALAYVLYGVGML